jgi:hypothetical protein
MAVLGRYKSPSCRFNSCPLFYREPLAFIMQIKAALAVTASLCAQSVYAHGYVPWLRIDGTTVVPDT